VQVVQVEVVDAEPGQRRLAVAADAVGAGIDVHAVLVADDPDLAGQHHLVASAGDRPTDQFLVVAGAVAHRGVQQGDADLDRAVHGGDGLLVVGRAIGLGHAHAAQADRGHGEALPTQVSRLHRYDARPGLEWYP